MDQREAAPRGDPVMLLGMVVASGLGSVVRYSLDQAVRRHSSRALPLGTLIINVTGSFALGLVLGLAAHQGLADGPALLLGAGFLGGYTTLSTWAWETLSLAGQRRPLLAFLNFFVSLSLGLAAAGAGFGLALL